MLKTNGIFPACTDGAIPGGGGISRALDQELYSRITNIAVGNPTTITTQFAHNLTTGDSVHIGSNGGWYGGTPTNSTPVISGLYQVTVADATHFTIPVNVTRPGSAGSYSNPELITSGANFSSGAGGKGQRHWVGDGVNIESGALSFSFAESNKAEFWVRQYSRWQTGFAWSPGLQYHKYWYFAAGVQPCEFAIPEFNGNDGMLIGTCFSNLNGSSTGGWKAMMGRNTSNGRWHCLEMHLDTVKGIADIWIDNVQRLHETRVDFGSAAKRGYRQFSSPENQRTPSNGGANFFEDVDDVAVSVAGRIGCTYGTNVS